MAIPQIAVEIAAPARAMAPSVKGNAEAQRTLLAACTAAAETGGDCVLARADLQPAVMALVFWRSPGHVRVEVGLAARSAPWAIRELEFSPEDPAIEKWRTVGYAVGALASEALTAKAQKVEQGGPGPPPAASPRGSHDGEAARAGGDANGAPHTASPEANGAQRSEQTATDSTGSEQAAPKAGPNPNEPQAGVTRADDRRAPDAIASPPRDTDASTARWALGLSGFLGPGFASVRGGGALRVSRRFRGPYATGALAYSTDAGDSSGISADRVALSAGGGYELPFGSGYGLGFRVEIVAEQLTARVDDPASHRTDTQGRWVAAVAVGAELARALAGPVGVVLGVDGTVRTNRTDVQVGNSLRTTIPMVDLVALAGVRVLVR